MTASADTQITERFAHLESPSVVLYSHDGYGLGHVSRTVYLAREIRARQPGANILIITSSPAAHRVSALHEFEYVKLPAVVKTGTERYRAHRLQASLEPVIAMRSELVLSILKRMRPDVFVVDHRPLGLKREIEPTLQWLRRNSPHTRTMVGLRDVIDEPQTVVREWETQGVYHALEHLYDEVLVYGDRAILDSTRAYAMPGVVARKTRFTGYLGRGAGHTRAEAKRILDREQGRYVVVHAGGGGDGLPLIKTYLESAARLPSDIHSLVVTGPLMEESDRRHLHSMAAGLPVTLTEFQEDLTTHIAAADLSVSMAGYNTICEVLSAGTRALIVPRVFPRREQYIRAQHLASRGLVSLLLPFDLNTERLVDAVETALTSSPSEVRLSLDGGARAASRICSGFERFAGNARPAVNE